MQTEVPWTWDPVKFFVANRNIEVLTTSLGTCYSVCKGTCCTCGAVPDVLQHLLATAAHCTGLGGLPCLLPAGPQEHFSAAENVVLVRAAQFQMTYLAKTLLNGQHSHDASVAVAEAYHRLVSEHVYSPRRDAPATEQDRTVIQMLSKELAESGLMSSLTSTVPTLVKRWTHINKRLQTALAALPAGQQRFSEASITKLQDWLAAGLGNKISTAAPPTQLLCTWAASLSRMPHHAPCRYYGRLDPRTNVHQRLLLPAVTAAAQFLQAVVSLEKLAVAGVTLPMQPPVAALAAAVDFAGVVLSDLCDTCLDRMKFQQLPNSWSYQPPLSELARSLLLDHSQLLLLCRTVLSFYGSQMQQALCASLLPGQASCAANQPQAAAGSQVEVQVQNISQQGANQQQQQCSLPSSWAYAEGLLLRIADTLQTQPPDWEQQQAPATRHLQALYEEQWQSVGYSAGLLGSVADCLSSRLCRTDSSSNSGANTTGGPTPISHACGSKHRLQAALCAKYTADAALLLHAVIKPHVQHIQDQQAETRSAAPAATSMPNGRDAQPAASAGAAPAASGAAAAAGTHRSPSVLAYFTTGLDPASCQVLTAPMWLVSTFSAELQLCGAAALFSIQERMSLRKQLVRGWPIAAPRLSSDSTVCVPATSPSTAYAPQQQQPALSDDSYSPVLNRSLTKAEPFDVTTAPLTASAATALLPAMTASLWQIRDFVQQLLWLQLKPPMRSAVHQEHSTVIGAAVQSPTVAQQLNEEARSARPGAAARPVAVDAGQPGKSAAVGQMAASAAATVSNASQAAALGTACDELLAASLTSMQTQVQWAWQLMQTCSLPDDVSGVRARFAQFSSVMQVAEATVRSLAMAAATAATTAQLADGAAGPAGPVHAATARQAAAEAAARAALAVQRGLGLCTLGVGMLGYTTPWQQLQQPGACLLLVEGQQLLQAACSLLLTVIRAPFRGSLMDLLPLQDFADLLMEVAFIAEGAGHTEGVSMLGMLGEVQHLQQLAQQGLYSRLVCGPMAWGLVLMGNYLHAAGRDLQAESDKNPTATAGWLVTSGTSPAAAADETDGYLAADAQGSSSYSQAATPQWYHQLSGCAKLLNVLQILCQYQVDPVETAISQSSMCTHSMGDGSECSYSSDRGDGISSAASGSCGSLSGSVGYTASTGSGGSREHLNDSDSDDELLPFVHIDGPASDCSSNDYCSSNSSSMFGLRLEAPDLGIASIKCHLVVGCLDALCMRLATCMNTTTCKLGPVDSANTQQQQEERQEPTAVSAALSDLADVLMQCGGVLCAAVPRAFCCNNPGCSNMSNVSEGFAAVRDRACVCGGCVGQQFRAPEGIVAARYCSRECQAAHRPYHKTVCGHLAAAAAAAAAVADCDTAGEPQPDAAGELQTEEGGSQDDVIDADQVCDKHLHPDK